MIEAWGLRAVNPKPFSHDSLENGTDSIIDRDGERSTKAPGASEELREVNWEMKERFGHAAGCIERIRCKAASHGMLSLRMR